MASGAGNGMAGVKPGTVTDREYGPGDRPAGTTALRAVLEVTVVGRGCPLSSTTEPGKNPVPLTVIVLEPGPPMMAGETNTIVGALEVTVGVTVSMVGVAVAPATVGVDVAP